MKNKGYETVSIRRYSGSNSIEETTRNLLTEEVLQVYINKKLAMKMVCTFDNLKELVIGHLYSEGVIQKASDVTELRLFADEKKAFVSLLQAEDKIRPFEMNSCNNGPGGIIGRERPLLLPKKKEKPFPWQPQWIFDLGTLFAEGAPLYEKTHAIHSCMLMKKGEFFCLCEDIGRHNALDKAIGKALMGDVPLEESILYTSGRMPLDMVRKAIRAGAGLLASNTVPTKEAVVLAAKYNLTLIGKVRPDAFELYTPAPAILKS